MFEKCAEQHSLTNQHLSQGTSGMKEKLGLNLSIGGKIPANKMMIFGHPRVWSKRLAQKLAALYHKTLVEA